MRVTTKHLTAWFNELNSRYFDDKLPIPRFAVGNSRTRLGSMSCKYRRTLLKRYYYDHCIRLSNYYDLSEDEFRNIFLHELIHYYISIKGIKDSSAHGVVFHKIMNSMNAQGWHITVCERGTLPVADSNLKKENIYIVAAIIMNDGSKLLSVVSPRNVRAIDHALRLSPELVSLSWFTTADRYFSTWPKVRTPRARRVTSTVFDEKVSLMSPLKL